MFEKLNSAISKHLPAVEASAHCDGPCGVYDPASARIAAEAVVSMTKKILELEAPKDGDQKALAAYHNTLSRYVSIKEEQAAVAKNELLILWTDFFKPQHLEANPNLHETFWKAAKLCSSCKVEVSPDHCKELMDAIKAIHEMFWKAKGRTDVPFYTAG